MKNIILAFSLLSSAILNAQYYYNDIIGTQEINIKMKTYLNAKVQSVIGTGYDENGRKSDDFNEWQDVQSNGTVLKVTTRNGQNVSRMYYHFDDQARLISTRDSATDVQTTSTYKYNAGGKLSNIKSVTKGSASEFDKTSERQWEYTAEGKPLRMLLIVNGNDSTAYRFTLDSNKNVGDEMLYHRGGVENQIYYTYDQQKVYYFYDDQNRLTDITKYNTKIDRLLPELMFEYDDNNRVIQRITVLSTVKYDTKRPDYFLWRYVYDEKGLRTREVLFSKLKEKKGEIKYAYTFAQ